MNGPEVIVPDWPAPRAVRALVTTRRGGTSVAPFDGFNLGGHVGDDPRAVAANRARLRAMLPAEPVWLDQVHGFGIVDAARATGVPAADGSFAREADAVCAVLTADCLPVLLCDEAGTMVAAAHAGWRGLAGGVVEAAVAAMDVAPGRLLAWLGPAIGPQAFEVGDDVRQAFLAWSPDAAAAFAPRPPRGEAAKWLADIYLLARLRLAHAGVERIFGGGFCTFGEPERFFSYRRDGTTGRMASLVWLER